MAAEERDELSIGQRRRRFAVDLALPVVVPILFSEPTGQAFVDRPGTEDQQIVVGGQPVHDVSNESVQVFDPVRLAGRPRAAAAVTYGGVVPNMARCAVMRRYLRFHSFDLPPVALHPDDDGLGHVDPDQRARPMAVSLGSHDRAHPS